MTLAKLKKEILAWANGIGDEIYAEDAAKKFKVSLDLVRKAFAELHKTKELVCADGCEKCDS